MICLKFDHFRKIAELEGKLAAAEALVMDQQAQIEILKSYQHEVTDWVLTSFGAPSLYGTKGEAPKAPAKPDPYASVRTPRDFQRVCDVLENEAFAANEALKR